MSGWTIMKGFRGYLSWYMRFLGKLGFGFLSLICAIGIAPLISIGGTGLIGTVLSMMQINFFVAGVVSTIVLTVSLFLISDKIYNVKSMEKSMEKLKSKLEKAKSFEKEMAGKPRLQRILRPVNLIGIVILVALLAIALINFRGFPDPAKNIQNATGNMLSDLGITPEDIKTFCGFIEGYNQTGTFSEDCAGPLELAQSLNATSFDDISRIIGQLPLYVDTGVKSLIESGSGEAVALMYRIEHNHKVYALAITVKQSMCTATEGKFCGCVNLGSLA
ncbi:MAG TPA: hypothetical protein VJ485_01930 [archaeon]|nr:hypothetical protein [archaeon]